MDLRGELTVTGIIPNCILCFLISTPSAALSSSKKLLFATDRYHYRKPQPVKMQRSTDPGMPAPVDTSTTQLLHLRLREIVGGQGPESLL